MLVNIHFNNTNSKKIAELYLFYRLREFSAKFGGSFKNFEFTKHEKHGTLPKLIALGWVTTDYKVSKYRNLVKKYSGSWANMDLTYLESLNKFKGFIIASLESSQLRSTWRRQNNKANVIHQEISSLYIMIGLKAGETNVSLKLRKSKRMLTLEELLIVLYLNLHMYL